MSFFRRLKESLLGFLKQGITPKKLALCVTLGILLGVIPVLGSTSLLCFLAAMLLRLNLPAIQVVNYVVYPLQFLLLIPFYRLGEWLFRAERLAISGTQVKELIQAGLGVAIRTLWTTTWHAVVAWGLACIPTGLVLYWILVKIFERMAARQLEVLRPKSEV